jgi:hypothetical protein
MTDYKVGEMSRDKRKPIIDTCSVMRATDQAKTTIESTLRDALNMLNDPRKDERLEKPECVFCFYYGDGRRIGGARCTTQECGLCDKSVHSGSTNVDVLCQSCAKANELCRHCGADLKLRVRRFFKAVASDPGSSLEV